MEPGVGSRRVLHQLPGLVVYEDGLTERCPPPLLPASSEFVDGVATKDVTINPRKGNWVRIFFPHSVAHRSPSSSLAPLVLHFHGGGLCFGSPAEPVYHNFCSRMASASNSIWISVHYRLAPEHRLPAQYQDCFEALCWLRSQFAITKQLLELIPILTSGQKEAWELEQEDLTFGEREPWVVDYGDSSKVFCIGESAGAIILHYVALKLVEHEWNPLNIRGLIFVDIGVLTDPLPEMTPFTDPFLTTKRMAVSVDLSLPDGVKLGAAVLDCLHPDCTCKFELQWPPILLFSAERDLLQEGACKYYTTLKEAGKNVELYEAQGKGHCFHLFEVDSEAARLRESTMVLFMRKLSL